MSLPVVLPVCDPVCGACGVVRRAGESGALRRRLSGKQKFCACGSACTRGSEATVGPVGATASEPVASVACWSQPPNSDAVAASGIFSPLPSSAGAADGDEAGVPDWMLSAAAWRRQYQAAWARVRRHVESLREVLPTRRTRAQAAFLECRDSFLSSSRLTLGFLADLPRDPFLVYLEAACERPFQRRSDPEVEDARRRCRCALLTWNGDFGRISGVEVSRDIEVMVQRLTADSGVRGLFREFEAWFTDGMQRCGVDVSWAVCAEVCEQSLGAGEARVHLHAGWRLRGPSTYLRVSANATEFSFRGQTPHWANASPTQRRSRNECQALFYCQVEKRSTLFRAANCEPHRDYHVQAEWAFALLEGNKISEEVARRLIIHGCKNVPAMLRNLEGYVAARRELGCQSMLDEARVALAAECRPAISVPAVLAWHALFEQHRFRYPFLVLDGPTRLRKTLYAQQQAPPGAALVMDCSGAVEPALHSFDPTTHRGIVFDEASASLVLRKRRLFQAPPERVALGGSATNCHLYHVVVYRQRLIVCTNRWQRDVDEMAPEDKAWLEGNCIYVRVDGPMWVPAAGAASV